MTLSELTLWLGWTVIVCIIFLLLTSFIYLFMRGWLMNIQRKIMGINELDISDAEMNRIYIRFFANYKILTLVFILAPYIALKIMGN